MTYIMKADEGPEYPRELGSTVAKFRRKANHVGSITEMLPADRRAYGEAVEKAILAKQRQALQRELPSHKCNCSSGTSLSDGREISAAVRAQHRAALQASVQRERRERKPEQWRDLYERAMKDKAERRARHSGGPKHGGRNGYESNDDRDGGQRGAGADLLPLRRLSRGPRAGSGQAVRS